MVDAGERARELARPPHGHVLHRPVHGPGGPTFPLTYLRTVGGSGTPIVVLPGGPGVASVVPYAGLRERAALRGLGVLMVEHRGVGLSRRTAAGDDLPVDAVTIGHAVDDLAAVLDDAGVGRAVLYGSSYGTYLAQCFGARHPDRVAGTVLDSPVLSSRAVHDARADLRRLLWEGTGPTADLAARVPATASSTCATLSAGKPPRRACSRTISASSARYTQYILSAVT
jgi:pimeloyl-ACP methyl ester carboxylesterase